MGLKKVCPRNPELNPVVTCITPHASHNDLANTEKKIHIMSCYIRHACHTSHSRKTPKVQNSSSKFKITHCCMGPKYIHPDLHNYVSLDTPSSTFFLIAPSDFDAIQAMCHSSTTRKHSILSGPSIRCQPKPFYL